MTVTDPIADMLTRIRNAVTVQQDTVNMPASKLKIEVSRILKEEGFISDFEVVKDKSLKTIKIQLRYYGRGDPALTGLKRISKPGLRVFVAKKEIPRVYGGLGVAIISTPKGLMTGQRARRQGVGGELLAYVW